MHIAIVNRWYPPAIKFGGVAVYNYCLSRELVKDGHRVTVIAARWDSETSASEVVEGVSVHRIRHPYRAWFRRLPVLGRHMRVICQMLYSLEAARRLHKLEKQDPPGAIEFADIEAEGFAYLCRKRRSPAVVRCHTPMFVLRHFYGLEELPFSTCLISWLEKFCIRHADAVTAPSHDMAGRIAKECGIPLQGIHVIPNCLGLGEFPVDRVRTVAAEAGEFTVVYVGRLERAKGVEVLARAVPMVLDRFPNARFVYVGGAEDMAFWRRRLESLIGEPAKFRQVTLEGALDDAELAEWYRRADVVVVPSLLYESFSYTCAQAMAAGVPVVASRIGGIPETLGYGSCGALVEPGDAEALARTIIDLAGDPRRRQAMGQAGRSRAATVFAVDRIASSTAHLYASIARTELPAKGGTRAPAVTLSE